MSKILSRKTEYFLSISIVTLLLLAFPGRSVTFKEWTCWKTELCTFKINHGELVSNQAMDCSCTVCPTIAGTTCNLSRHFFLFFFFPLKGIGDRSIWKLYPNFLSCKDRICLPAAFIDIMWLCKCISDFPYESIQDKNKITLYLYPWKLWVGGRAAAKALILSFMGELGRNCSSSVRLIPRLLSLISSAKDQQKKKIPKTCGVFLFE